MQVKNKRILVTLPNETEEIVNVSDELNRKKITYFCNDTFGKTGWIAWRYLF